MNLSYPTYMKHKTTVCLGAKILGTLAILQTAALALGTDSLERDFVNPPAMHRPATFAFMHTTGGPVADQGKEGFLGGKALKTGRYTFTSFNPYKKDAKLLPSGLLGPVQVLTSE